MLNTLFGEKKDQYQKFLEDGTRIPVTEVVIWDMPVIMVKSLQKDGYAAIQLGMGKISKPSKALLGHIRGAKVQDAPRFLREVRITETIDSTEIPKVGTVLKATDVFKPGDIVDVCGISKGKGFAGGVKRHHFKGGPRTHGQSDRERAPGSIGQTTTPGRVYKGKRMAGRMGAERVTVQNLLVVDVVEQKLLIKGLIPGSRNTLIMVKKKKEAKKFVPLYKTPIKAEENEVKSEKIEEEKK